MKTYLSGPWVYYAVVYFLIVSVRLPCIIWPPSELLYNVDELELTLSAVDRFLGVATTGLHWPGTFLHFLFLPLFVFDYLLRTGVRSGMTANLVQWSLYIGEVYRHPAHALSLMRVVSLLLSSAFPIIIYSLLRYLSINRTMAVIFTIAVVSSETMSQHAVMATGDAASITLAFASFALVVLFPNLSWRDWVAGLLMAAAACSKLTALNLITAPAVYMMLESHEAPIAARARRVLRLAAVFIVGILIWLPYLRTDPSRTVKAIVGNVNKLGSVPDFRVFLHHWNEAAGLIIVSLTFVAWLLLPVALRDRHRRPFLLACATSLLCVSVPLYLRATSTFARYYVPLVPLAILLIAGTCSTFKETYIRRISLSATIVVLVVVSVFGIIDTIQIEWSLRAGYPLSMALREADKITNITTEVFVPEQARLAGFEIPSATYERIYNRLTEELSAKRGLVAFLDAHGIPGDAASIFEAAFNEKDTSALARANAMIYPRSERSEKSRVVLWCDSESSGEIRIERTALCEYDRTQARQLFLSRPGAVILVREPDPSLGELLSDAGDRWLWYRNLGAR